MITFWPLLLNDVLLVFYRKNLEDI